MGDEVFAQSLADRIIEYQATLAHRRWCREPVILRIKSPDVTLVMDWAAEYLGPGARSSNGRLYGRWDHQMLSWMISPWSNGYLMYGFRRQADAILFRLQWSEHVVPKDSGDLVRIWVS